MRAFRCPEYWAWLFKGEARAEFMRLPPAQQEVSVRAMLRLRMFEEDADQVRLKHQHFAGRKETLWFGSFGKKEEHRAVWAADIVINLRGTFGAVVKDRTGTYRGSMA